MDGPRRQLLRQPEDISMARPSSEHKTNVQYSHHVIRDVL
jgi:hypothetical protein